MLEKITIEENLNKVSHLIKERDFKTALLVLEEVINAESDSVQAFFYLGNIFHLKGEIGKAIKAFTKVLELNPGHTDAAVSLSVLYNDIGKYEEAQKVFDRANLTVKNTSTGLSDPHVSKKFSLKHLELAEMYDSYARYEEALIEYDKSAALDPTNLAIKLKVAKTYSKKGFHTKAIEELKKLKREQPNYLEARVALGLVFHGLGNIVDAQNEWQNVLLKDAKNQEARLYLNLSANVNETVLN